MDTPAATPVTPPLKVSEAARALNVHRQTILAMIDAGELPAVKIGQQWRISADAVAALLAPLARS
jgi:excisionase family DNA binding protein